MEKFLIEVEDIPTEEASKALYGLITEFGAVNMFYTGSKAYIYGELTSGAIDRVEGIIADKGYDYKTDRG